MKHIKRTKIYDLNTIMPFLGKSGISLINLFNSGIQGKTRTLAQSLGHRLNAPLELGLGLGDFVGIDRLLKKYKECVAVEQVPGCHSAKSFLLFLSSSSDNEGVGGRQPMASLTGSLEGGTR